MANRLLLVDASALMYRGCTKHLESKYPTAFGLYAFTREMIKYCTAIRPTHACVALDHLTAPTQRSQTFPDYKRNRRNYKPALKSQFTQLPNLLNTLRLQSYSQQSYEADDIIYTFAKRYESNPDVSIHIITPDKDMFPLLSQSNVTIYPYSSPNIEWSKDKLALTDNRIPKRSLNVKPNQIWEFLALVGDASDNIAGVPMIGSVTASILLRNHTTMKECFTALEETRQRTPYVLSKKFHSLLDNKEAFEKSFDLISLAQIPQLTDDCFSEPFEFSGFSHLTSTDAFWFNSDILSDLFTNLRNLQSLYR